MYRPFVHLVIAAFVSLCATQSAPAQVLKGGVEEDVPAFKEKCICVNPNKVKAQEVNGVWQLVDEDALHMPISNSEAGAAAVNMIKQYGITNACSLGDMTYFKSPNGAPQGAISGEDAIRFDSSTTKAEQKNGSWKVTSAGDLWLLDFGADQDSAEQAADIIRFYGFTNQCFVGNPARVMMYWHK